jgi:hypothetical protein
VEEEEEEEEEAKVSVVVVVVKEETDTIEEDGPFPDDQYPTAPEWDDQDPDDVQQEPPIDSTYCHICLQTHCLFLQWQEDLEASVEIMYPEETNRAKRYHMYRRMSRELNGHLGKGNRKPLPGCFTQGLRDLYPEGEGKKCTGFKHPRDDGNGDGSIII